MATSPDIIILNGKLITFDPDQPKAQALAITGGLISAVGENDDIKALAGANSKMVDAKGGTVLPGFIDSHVHLFGGSFELSCLDLYEVEGLDAMKAAIRPYADANPDEKIVFCIQADYDILGLGRTLTRHDLDQKRKSASGAPKRPSPLFALPFRKKTDVTDPFAARNSQAAGGSGASRKECPRGSAVGCGSRPGRKA
jgi:predicted amidohydrolase YtcJ